MNERAWMRGVVCASLAAVLSVPSACSQDGCLLDTDCEGTSICADGRCVDPESQRCPGKPCGADEVCYGGTCIPADCDIRDCPEGWGCLHGLCEDPACAEVDCGGGERCAGGRCYPQDCESRHCPGLGEICVDEVCTQASCLGKTCPSGETCAQGQCYPADCDPPCEGTRVCVQDECLERSCVGVHCPQGQTCAYGYCYFDDCPSETCEAWEVCKDGDCTDASCTDLTCPQAERCALGRCWPEDCPGQACASGQVCVEGTCTGLACLGGRCDDPCRGVTCDRPPADVCIDGWTLQRSEEIGTCVQGECSHAVHDEHCDRGCEDGQCLDACHGVVCEQPPANECLDASTLRAYDQTGSCVDGECLYGYQDQYCGYGCQAGECLGPCHGVVCDSPPADVCLDAITLRDYEDSGTCTEGECIYEFTDRACAEGCADGRCICSDECQAGSAGCDGELAWACEVQADGCNDQVPGQDCAALEAEGQLVYTCRDGACACRTCCNLPGQCPGGVSTEDCPGGLCCPAACGSTGETAIYVSVQRKDGLLGGRSGADAFCAGEKPSGLHCSNVRAFLTVNANDEIRDMPSNYGFSSGSPMYFYDRSANALTLFATSWADALDGSIQVTPHEGLGCCSTALYDFWTGSNNDGSHATNPPWDYTCDGWVSTANLGMQGEFDSDTSWIRGPDNMISCAASGGLYMLCACRL